MAIRLIQGEIGSGKTYYAVIHVLKTYYTWSDELDSWVPKEKDVDVRVYTNIKYIKLGEDLHKYIADAGDECFKTKRIKQDQKVFGMYRSMIIGEGEKIRSIHHQHQQYTYEGLHQVLYT